MRRPDVSDKKLLLLLAFLLMSIIIMGLIWRHYDIELSRLERQKNELILNRE